MVRALSLAAVLSLALIATGCKDDYDSVMKKTIDKMNELNTALASVKDAASSKAAAPKVKSITEDLQELKKKADAMPKPSADQEKKLKETHEKQLNETMGKLMGEMMRIGMNPSLMTPELQEALKGMEKIK
jgi:hypothetical protein